MKTSILLPYGLGIITFLVFSINGVAQKETVSAGLNKGSIRVEYIKADQSADHVVDIPECKVNVSGAVRLTTYRNKFYKVMIHEIERGDYTEINGELEYLDTGTSALTTGDMGNTWLSFY